MNQITELALDDLHESPSNPRKHFAEAYLQELAADIKSHGRVLQPLLVRPRVPALFQGANDPNATVGHEIVFGHCRYRAARLAGLATVPCMVRPMDDLEVKRAQISENLARKDVHPIEEAEGFQALIDEHNETADRIAEQTGKSRSYVYGRLKLLQACPEVRKACLAGEIGSEVALLVARLRLPKLQERALSEIKSRGHNLADGGKRSFRTIRELLADRYTLDLDKAPFPIDEEMLLPKAHACQLCPKRSGNAPEFEDIATEKSDRYYVSHPLGPNVCTDPDCYGEKKVAFFKRQADAMRTKGKTVIEGAKAKAALDTYGRLKGDYLPASEVRDQISEARRAAQRDAKIVPPLVVTIQDPRTGKSIEAVKVKELVAAGVREATEAPPHGQQANANAAAERQKKEAQVESTNAMHRLWLTRVRAAAASADRSAFDLRMIADAAVEAMADSNDEEILCELWGVEHIGALSERIETLTRDELALLLLDCALVRDMTVNYWRLENKPQSLLAAAKYYGVSLAPETAPPAEAEEAAQIDRPSEPTPAPPAASLQAAWPFPTPPPAARAQETAPVKTKAQAQKSAAAPAAGPAAATTAVGKAPTAKQPGGPAAPKVKVDAGVAAGECTAQASLLDGADA